MRMGAFLGMVAAAIVAVAQPAVAQFTSFSRVGGHAVLEGNWQSCREVDGRYTERVYDHVVNGVGQFEVHLGPGREFALFKGIAEEHRDHGSPQNLLQPHRVPMEASRAKQRWEISSLSLVFTVTLAGGARTDCDSWFILLEPLGKPSH